MMQLCNDTMIYHLLLDLTTSKLPHKFFFVCMSCVLVVGHIPDHCVFSIINVAHSLYLIFSVPIVTIIQDLHPRAQAVKHSVYSLCVVNQKPL